MNGVRDLAPVPDRPRRIVLMSMTILDSIGVDFLLDGHGPRPQPDPYPTGRLQISMPDDEQILVKIERADPRILLGDDFLANIWIDQLPDEHGWPRLANRVRRGTLCCSLEWPHAGMPESWTGYPTARSRHQSVGALPDW